MEIKKTPEADLENKRFTWLLVGYVVALAVMFVTLEWSTDERELNVVSQTVAEMVFEEDIAPVVMEQVEELMLPEVPEIVSPASSSELVLVDDTAEVDEINLVSTEGNTEQPAAVATTEKIREVASEEVVYEYVEQLPEFPNGGQAALRRYLSKNLKYPENAQSRNIQGCVICQFVVNRDGTIADVRVIQSVDVSIDEEAVRVISTMPRWKPGIRQGNPVRVRFTLPIVFRL